MGAFSAPEGNCCVLEKLAREGRIDLATVFDRLPTPFMMLDRDFTFVGLNQAYLEATSRDRDSIIGLNVFDAFPAEGESRRLLLESLERARDTGRTDVLPYLEYPIPQPEALGGGFVMRYWSCTHTPIPDAEGVTEFIVQHTQDVTELHDLRELAGGTRDGGPTALRQNILRRAETVQAEGAELRRLFNAAPGFMTILRGPDHVFEWCNAAYSKLVGRGDLVGRSVWDVMPDVAAQGYSQLLDSVRSTQEPFVGRGMRVLFDRANGEQQERFLDFVYQPIVSPEGECTGIFVQGNDVTDAIRASKRQRLLLNELNHRVKNTLATVQAILGQTLKTSSREEFADHLSARIQGLAKTHEVLTRTDWLGASLSELLSVELEPYGEERFLLNGADLTLPPKAALALGMVFHELATNACKYGPLTQDDGQVRVSWDVEATEPRPTLVLEWRETGGPDVATPTRQGFGSRLIERSLAGELGGQAELKYEREGFRCTLRAPLEELNP
jgi:two-component sensor histidine kinase